MSKSDTSPLGSLPLDDNGRAVQSGGTFTTTDATGTPQTSPISYTTGVVTIVVPDGAIECILMPTTDLKVSALVDISSYDLVLANSKESFPVSRQQNVYVQRSSANGSLYIRFTVV